MRGEVFTGVRTLDIMEFPDPEPRPNDVVRWELEQAEEAYRELDKRLGSQAVFIQ